MAEDIISIVEDHMAVISKDLQLVSHNVQALLDKVDDLENRSCRNNICLVGVPEKSEGLDPVSFFEKCLQDVCGPTVLFLFFAIEQAHRVLTRPLPPGAPPLPVLLKLLHYRDRDTILPGRRKRLLWMDIKSLSTRISPWRLRSGDFNL